MALAAAERSIANYIIVAHDPLIIPCLVALREHLIGTNKIDREKITLAFLDQADPEQGQTMNKLYAAAPQTFEQILTELDSQAPVNVICSDTHLPMDCYAEVRRSVQADLERGRRITLSLFPDGSANRVSSLGDEELKGLLSPANREVETDTYYHFGYIPRDSVALRRSFFKENVNWSLVNSFFTGSKLWTKEPYPSLAKIIDEHIGGSRSVIWIPMRALCNDAGYHASMYSFGRDQPGVTSFRIYNQIIEHISRASGLADAPIIFIGDVRTEHVLDGNGPALAKEVVGENAMYLLQPPEVRFDFIFADFCRRRREAVNYLVCGDSTTAIPLIGSYYNATYIFGYPCEEYLRAGATSSQWIYAQDRVNQWIMDAVAVFGTSRAFTRSSMSVNRIADYIYKLDIRM